MTAATRIALISDTHTWDDQTPGDAPPNGPEHAAMLLDASPTLHALLLEQIAASGAALALHLGDMTCGGGFFGMDAARFAPLLARLRADYAALPMPVHALPGNHDTPPGAGGWAQFEALWGLPPGQGQTLDLDGLRLLLINAQGHDASQIAAALPADPIYGWVNEAELARVEEAIATANGRPVLAFVHQLAQPWHNGAQPWKEYYGIANATALRAALACHPGVKVLFQGHAHRYERATLAHNGWRAQAVLAPSVIEFPVGWLQLDVTATGATISLCQLPAADLLLRSACNGAQRWRAPEALRQWRCDW